MIGLCTDPENSVMEMGGPSVREVGVLTMLFLFLFFSRQHISQGGVGTTLEKQLDPGPIAFRAGSVPGFLWKTITIFLFFKRGRS